jgi:transposase-like zinc ribbon protein
MIDFPITDLFDDSLCLIWLERHLHPDGFVCPQCGRADRCRFRAQDYYDAYRCRACAKYYSLLSGSAFESSRRSFTLSATRQAKNANGWSPTAIRSPVTASLRKPFRPTRPSCIRMRIGVTTGSGSSTRQSITLSTSGRAMTMATACAKSTTTGVKELALGCARECGRSVASIRCIFTPMWQRTRR